MGTSKKNYKKKEPKVESLPDDVLTGTTDTTSSNFTFMTSDGSGTSNTWINVASAACGIPSGAKRNPILDEIDRQFGAIFLSENKDAIWEAERIIDECRTKLQILRRDKKIA